MELYVCLFNMMYIEKETRDKMELQTISQVANDYGISTRMLRYYEQVGLIESLRKPDYAYRVYNETALIRLRQIIILRKLRIPVKQIIRILDHSDASQIVEIFRQTIEQLDTELTALSTVKSILIRFAEEISAMTNVSLNLLGDEALFSVINALPFSDNQIKETKENVTMNELTKASDDLNKLTDKDVRIIYLPPMTIAAAYASGEGCESQTIAIISHFVTETNLLAIKPDARSFGFDCSEEAVSIGENSQIYESWVSIPKDMEVPSPLVKRQFKGGLYAAHVLRAWDFADWRWLKEWIEESEQYDNDWGSPRWNSAETVFGQGFEETLNFYNFVQTHHSEMNYLQLDLLFPIKET